MIRESAKISFKQTLKRFAVPRLVARHLVNGVVDCVEVQGFCALCKVCFAPGRAVFGIYAQLEISFCAAGNDVTEQLCEFRGVLRLFIRGLAHRQAGKNPSTIKQFFT